MSTGPFTLHEVRETLSQLATGTMKVSRVRDQQPVEPAFLHFSDDSMWGLACTPEADGGGGADGATFLNVEALGPIPDADAFAISRLERIAQGTAALQLVANPVPEVSQSALLLLAFVGPKTVAPWIIMAASHEQHRQLIAALDFLRLASSTDWFVYRIWCEADDSNPVEDGTQAGRHNNKVNFDDLSGAIARLGLLIRGDVLSRSIKVAGSGVTSKQISQSKRWIDSGLVNAVARRVFVHEHLRQLFNQFSVSPDDGPADRRVVDAECLSKFLRLHQGENEGVAYRGVPMILQTCCFFGHNTDVGESDSPSGLSFVDFTSFLVDPNSNHWQSPMYREPHAPVQDMTQPLHHYWIATARCPLTEDQLRGALAAGCRCIELEITDGAESDGAPAVAVPHTPSAREWLEIIHRGAFEAGNDFPLILNIIPAGDVSESALNAVAQIIGELFGDAVLKWSDFDETVEAGRVPAWCPVLLKRKVLVAFKLVDTEPSFQYPTTDLSQEPAKKADLSELPPHHSSIASLAILGHRVPHHWIKALEGDSADLTVVPARPEDWAPSQEAVWTEVDCTWIAPLTVPFMEVIRRRAGSLSCVTRNMFVRYLQLVTDVIKAVGQSEDHAVWSHAQYDAISPADLAQAWADGVQFVPMTYGRWTPCMQLHEARFRLNGSCGYALKPEYLRSLGSDAAVGNLKSSQQLSGSAATGGWYAVSLVIVSAHQLPGRGQRGMAAGARPTSSSAANDAAGDAFYVKVELTGHRDDMARHPSWSSASRTATIGGDHVVWNQRCAVETMYAEVASITVKVVRSTSDEVVGEATSPIVALRRGIRAVPLCSPQDGTDIPFASLLCEIHLGRAK